MSDQKPIKTGPRDRSPDRKTHGESQQIVDTVKQGLKPLKVEESILHPDARKRESIQELARRSEWWKGSSSLLSNKDEVASGNKIDEMTSLRERLEQAQIKLDELDKNPKGLESDDEAVSREIEWLELAIKHLELESKQKNDGKVIEEEKNLGIEVVKKHLGSEPRKDFDIKIETKDLGAEITKEELIEKGLSILKKITEKYVEHKETTEGRNLGSEEIPAYAKHLGSETIPDSVKAPGSEIPSDRKENLGSETPTYGATDLLVQNEIQDLKSKYDKLSKICESEIKEYNRIKSEIKGNIIEILKKQKKNSKEAIKEKYQGERGLIANFNARKEKLKLKIKFRNEIKRIHRTFDTLEIRNEVAAKIIDMEELQFAQEMNKNGQRYGITAFLHWMDRAGQPEQFLLESQLLAISDKMAMLNNIQKCSLELLSILKDDIDENKYDLLKTNIHGWYESMSKTYHRGTGELKRRQDWLINRSLEEQKERQVQRNIQDEEVRNARWYDDQGSLDTFYKSPEYYELIGKHAKESIELNGNFAQRRQEEREQFASRAWHWLKPGPALQGEMYPESTQSQLEVKFTPEEKLRLQNLSRERTRYYQLKHSDDWIKEWNEEAEKRQAQRRENEEIDQRMQEIRSISDKLWNEHAQIYGWDRSSE